MAVTMSNIAERAGLDVSAVSRVLSGKARKYRISADAERRVLEAARELNYRPNAAARATATGRFSCAAVVDTTAAGRSSLPQRLIAGLCDALAERQMSMTIVRLRETARDGQAEAADILHARYADGLLINCSDPVPEALVVSVRSLRLPSIWINARFDSDCIHPDDFTAALLATRRLLAAGHRRIAYLDLAHDQRTVAAKHYSVADREAGYAAAMHEAGLTPTVHRPGQPLEPEGYLPMVHALLRSADRPTGVVGYGQPEAQTLFLAAAQRRWQPGKQLSHVYFDEVQNEFGHLGMRYAGTATTAYVIDSGQLGHRAVAMLERKIAEPETALDPVAVPYAFASGQTIGPPCRDESSG